MTVDHIDAIYQFNEQAGLLEQGYEDIFSIGGPTVTKILNGYYIELAREKEALYETK